MSLMCLGPVIVLSLVWNFSRPDPEVFYAASTWSSLQYANYKTDKQNCVLKLIWDLRSVLLIQIPVSPLLGRIESCLI